MNTVTIKWRYLSLFVAGNASIKERGIVNDNASVTDNAIIKGYFVAEGMMKVSEDAVMM